MSDNEEIIKVGKDTFEKLIANQQLHETIEKNEKFQEAVNLFYTLKGQYEEQIQDLRRTIAKKPNLSNKEKRDEFKKLKLQCVNCKRKVGTIFEVKYDKSGDGRRAKALCGDRVDPCPLDIEINLGKISTVGIDLQETQDEMNELKRKIVIIKNDLLFGYVTTEKAVEEFEKVKMDLSQTTEMYEILLISYLSIYDSPEKKEDIKKLELDIYNDIKLIKTYISDFNREKNVQFVHDAVTLMVSQITPKIIELRHLKYPVMYVEPLDKKQCKLIQKSLEYSLTETDNAIKPQEVIALKLGVK